MDTSSSFRLWTAADFSHLDSAVAPYHQLKTELDFDWRHQRTLDTYLSNQYVFIEHLMKHGG